MTKRFQTSLPNEDILISALGSPSALDYLPIVIPSRGPVLDSAQPECQEALRELQAEGATVISHPTGGGSDVARARCLAVHEWAVTIGRAARRGDPIHDTVLLLDDDMILSKWAAATLVRLSRLTACPVSAAYVQRQAQGGPPVLAASILPEPRTPIPFDSILDVTSRPQERIEMPQAYVGLGACAVPRRLLMGVWDRAPVIVERDGDATRTFRAVSWTGPARNANGDWQWVADDTCLCELLAMHDGRLPLLAPIRAGHVRRGDGQEREVLWPDGASEAMTSTGRAIPW